MTGGLTALQGMYTTFRANVPQLFIDVDRDQVLTKNVASLIFVPMLYYIVQKASEGGKKRDKAREAVSDETERPSEES